MNRANAARQSVTITSWAVRTLRRFIQKVFPFCYWSFIYNISNQSIVCIVYVIIFFRLYLLVCNDFFKPFIVLGLHSIHTSTASTARGLSAGWGKLVSDSRYCVHLYIREKVKSYSFNSKKYHKRAIYFLYIHTYINSFIQNTFHT